MARMNRRPEPAVVFVQLPQLDNDTGTDHENVALAAAYLRYGAERAGEDRFYRFSGVPAGLREADTPTLAQGLAAERPAVLAMSLYLWNVERSLRLARAVKALSPGTRVVAGGPEVALSHPFLFRAGVADALVVGEGEAAFPRILADYRRGRQPDLAKVAVKTPRGYRWGAQPLAEIELRDAVPPPGYPACRPDDRGVAYLETSRGCPFRCTYCRYPHLRRRMTFLDPDAVASRVAALRRLGAREIRFVDPTFNAHPRFDGVLERLVEVNRDRGVRFFVELGAERLTESQAERLAKAHVAEVEVGLQSRDPRVLSAIRRPTDLGALERGVRRLVRHGMRVTLDVMYGLPLQRRRDVEESLRWARRLRGVDVQCLQTLLLPGTELRERSREWGIRAGRLPPYAVMETRTLAARDLRWIEHRLESDARLRSDIRTERFVGPRVPGVFSEQVLVDLAAWRSGQGVGGFQARRALVLRCDDWLAMRRRLSALIRRAIRQDPDMLWQFVLDLRQEEPLEVLDAALAAVRDARPHLVDRYAAVNLTGRIASRRVFVQLSRGRRWDADWVAAAEACLAEAFF